MRFVLEGIFFFISVIKKENPSQCNDRYLLSKTYKVCVKKWIIISTKFETEHKLYVKVCKKKFIFYYGNCNVAFIHCVFILDGQFVKKKNGKYFLCH